jgi:hypothetical protein
VLINLIGVLLAVSLANRLTLHFKKLLGIDFNTTVVVPDREWVAAETVTGFGNGVAVGRGVGVVSKFTTTGAPDGLGSVSGVAHPVPAFVKFFVTVKEGPFVECAIIEAVWDPLARAEISTS